MRVPKLTSVSLVILFIVGVVAVFVPPGQRTKYDIAISRLHVIVSFVKEYSLKHGKLPVELLEAFSDGDKIPEDPYLQSNKVVKVFDGTGGWVYDRGRLQLKLNYQPFWPPWRDIPSRFIPPEYASGGK